MNPKVWLKKLFYGKYYREPKEKTMCEVCLKKVIRPCNKYDLETLPGANLDSSCPMANIW